MKFYIYTLGCKVNQYESELMREMLINNGYSYADSLEETDILIVNSCTVTSTGDSKCRKYINRARRVNESCIIVLCGCMPQAFSSDITLFKDCDIVLGNTCRKEIVEAIDTYLKDRKQLIRITEHQKNEKFENMKITNFDVRTRAYIKIEDGCNRFCTYCIIPYARGRVRSKDIVTLRNEAKTLAENGFKEIVLVGINLSAYGQDIEKDICDAVSSVCSVEGIERVRLGSIEPERMSKDVLLKLSKEQKFCPHFHLSLQSGCDETLKRMHRHYSAEEYYEIVKNIREIFENPSITTDIMVGFAGESEKEFIRSLEFCDMIGFAKSHVFQYSKRKGTKAYSMPDQVSSKIKLQRSKKMIEHMNVSQEKFMKSQVGLTESVLFESKSENDIYEGYTKNYTKVKVKSENLISNKIYDVKITKSFQDYCEGELLK